VPINLVNKFDYLYALSDALYAFERQLSSRNEVRQAVHHANDARRMNISHSLVLITVSGISSSCSSSSSRPLLIYPPSFHPRLLYDRLCLCFLPDATYLPTVRLLVTSCFDFRSTKLGHGLAHLFPTEVNFNKYWHTFSAKV